MTVPWTVTALLAASNLILFGLLAVAAYGLLSTLPARPNRWTRWSRRPAGFWPEPVLRLAGLRADSPSLASKARLLAGSGFNVEARQYEAWRRLFLLISALAVSAAFGGWLPLSGAGAAMLAASGLAAAVLLSADNLWLGALRDYRTHRIVRDIYALTRQLLYYEGSGMNLYVKLSRCLPFAGKLRDPLQRLLADWYADPEAALDRFRDRLGTEEGHSFAETLQAMRLNDDPAYYGLLRLRLQDYKEKIELHRESRKESVSYILFVIAGLPIFYTFRVFLHPWIREGQLLFESLQ
ncbi:hypothetical protein ACFQWB_13765 [Paenibacillus thermoaerophilus]|uniref:Flp pilus assembly protein TadB n=1 Tax=Paenibacillus thermoaerophilus TaxID=1215385 RepID=A0ABW2V9L2_9BACL|nr:hypothetical protein [Paenibacillus thermoaerophilus]TMV16113.1 hypothetical protein FE781_08560 [Paenibacillus thermoaerophilus]